MRETSENKYAPKTRDLLVTALSRFSKRHVCTIHTLNNIPTRSCVVAEEIQGSSSIRMVGLELIRSLFLKLSYTIEPIVCC